MGLFSKIVDVINNAKNGFVSAIILCAGSSTRFSDEGENKQLAEVNGKPVIERTLTVFDNCQSINEIILVVRKEDAESYKSFVYDKGFKKIKCIVTGGPTRQSSALRGFKYVSNKAKYVAIHDGARCLVTENIIETVLKEANKHGIATAASRVTDTVKMSDKDGFIYKTIDRNNLWNVQTPQIFEYKKYQISAYKAKQDDFAGTDDCMLAEHAKFKVKLVDTGNDNIKITVKDDIKRAELILSARGEKWELVTDMTYTDLQMANIL